MQKVAAYLLERLDGIESIESRAREFGVVKTAVKRWLASKGASNHGPSGTYRPEDESDGTFNISELADGDQELWMLQLNEETNEGRRVHVVVSIISTENKISVYITLEMGWMRSEIMPSDIDMRCPRIVRDLLKLPGSWYHGSSTLQQLQQVKSFENGEILAKEIQNIDRTVPIVVVSSLNETDVVLPKLGNHLSYDLAGLANVVVVDENASWALTDTLGSEFSCYRGAIRLYWPHFSKNQDRFFHPLWTAERLRSTGYDVEETTDRFRRQLRGLIFRAAALSVVRPRVIDDIQDTASRQAVEERTSRATSLKEYQELATIYVDDNNQLRAERTSLRSKVEELEAQVAKLESDRQALRAQLAATKSSTSTTKLPSSTGEIVPDGADGISVIPPKPGEIRFGAVLAN